MKSVALPEISAGVFYLRFAPAQEIIFGCYEVGTDRAGLEFASFDFSYGYDHFPLTICGRPRARINDSRVPKAGARASLRIASAAAHLRATTTEAAAFETAKGAGKKAKLGRVRSQLRLPSHPETLVSPTPSARCP